MSEGVVDHKLDRSNDRIVCRSKDIRRAYGPHRGEGANVGFGIRFCQSICCTKQGSAPGDNIVHKKNFIRFWKYLLYTSTQNVVLPWAYSRLNSLQTLGEQLLSQDRSPRSVQVLFAPSRSLDVVEPKLSLS